MDKKTIMVISGDNVRRYRESRGLSREELAELVDYDPSTIARIESGTRMMSLLSLIAIAEALKTSTDSLLKQDSLDENQLSDVVSMLASQSPSSCAKLKKILYTCITEYGDEETHH